MPWYEVRVLATTQAEAYRGGRGLFVWDDRSQAEIKIAVDQHGAVTLKRASFKDGQTRLEARGEITVMKPHLVSIEDRVDLNNRFPHGPQQYGPGA